MSFKERIRCGEHLIGTLLSINSTEVAEILSRSGFDWLFLDLEHSALGPAEGQTMLQAIGQRIPVLVRVESRDETGIRKALDIGADGIIVPQVNSAAEAARVVALSKYPPAGQRSVGLGRAANFGNGFGEYISRANAQTVVVVQIEHISALQEIEQIAGVAGIDAFLVGPYDLSGSVGKPGELDAPEVTAAINKIVSVAKAHRVACGIFAPTAAAGRRYQELGFTLLTIATDGMLLGRAAAAELKELGCA